MREVGEVVFHPVVLYRKCFHSTCFLGNRVYVKVL